MRTDTDKSKLQCKMRAQSKAPRPFSLNASQGTLSRSPTPSRGPPRRSSKSDTTRISVTTRRLENCSRWFSIERRSSNILRSCAQGDRPVDRSNTHKSREGSRWVGSSTMSVARLLTRSQLIAVHCTHSSARVSSVDHHQSLHWHQLQQLHRVRQACTFGNVPRSAPQGGTAGALRPSEAAFP